MVLAAAGWTAGCYRGGLMGTRVPAAILEGWVFSFEDAAPLAHAEVCVFGTDTSCVRADARGHYRTRVPAESVSVRFRTAGLPPATSPRIDLTSGERRRLDCAISDRVPVGPEPSACLSLPRP